MLSIIVCLIATLGGVGTVWGPVIGAFILIPISEFTRIQFGGGGKGTDLIIYGFLIMVISIYQPFGVIGITKRLKKRSPRDGSSGSERAQQAFRWPGGQRPHRPGGE